MSTIVSYRWKPLEDLPSNYESLAQLELRSLSQIWAEQKTALTQAEALRTFNEQLRREWAIETGVIEQLYTLDRGITLILIERGIDAAFIPHGSTNRNPELVASMIRDHEAAIETLFSFVKEERKLSTSYIKELHALLTRHQATCLAIDSLGQEVEVPLLKGDYKNLPNNPKRRDGTIHEYAPPEQVASEMDRLIQLHADHIGRGVVPEVEAAWLHHRFSQIHPFQDGNGRVARCLATLMFLRADWFPLVITRDHRDRYIDALETADHESLEPLVRLFATLQKQAFVKALGLSAQVLSPARPEQVIGAARRQLLEREKTLRKEWERAKELAAHLQRVLKERLDRVVASLEADLGPLLRGHRFNVDSESPGGVRGYYFRGQIIETARRLSSSYFVNTSDYRAWTRLVLRTDTQAEILFAFHAIGREYRGLLAVSACFFRRELTEDGERQVTDLTPLTDDIFQINYREAPPQAEMRFRQWFEATLTKGLEMWRQGL